MKREPWETLAWALWRHKGLSYEQVSAHLASEGWAVPPGRLEDSLMRRAGAELKANWDAASGRKLGGT